MEDLNQKAGCPDEASEEAKEVRTKNSDLMKQIPNQTMRNIIFNSIIELKFIGDE